VPLDSGSRHFLSKVTFLAILKFAPTAINMIDLPDLICWMFSLIATSN
jgi:hypothetical protein